MNNSASKMIPEQDWRDGRARAFAPAAATPAPTEYPIAPAPLPPQRFPWLSWSARLDWRDERPAEQATRPRSSFDGAPPLGTSLDKYA
jgi:hypothetical protein